MSTAREELHQIIEKLNDDDVKSTLHLLKKVVVNYYEIDNEELIDEDIRAIEHGREQIVRGEYVDFEDLKKEYGL